MACNPERTTDELAQVRGIPIYILCRTVNLYNKGGADFQEKLHWGGRRRETSFLSLEQEAEMMEGFKDKTRKGELTAKDIKKDVEKKLNREVSDDYLWALFRRHHWKKKAPRPKHASQNPQAQEELKKTPRILTTYFAEENDPRPIKLFFEDEARFGRINKVSGCWMPKESRAEVGQQMVREYIYAYTSVCPETGENYSIISPVNNTSAMNVFLEEFSGVYKHYRVIMELDGIPVNIYNYLPMFSS